MLSRISGWMHACVLSLFLFTGATGVAQDGENLFKANCASCHKLDKKLVGPALAGIQDRWEDEANLIAWIKNSQQYLADNPGDGYASGLFEEYNGSIMPAMPLTDDEVKAVLGYIANPPVAAAPVEVSTPGPVQSGEDYSTYWIIGFLAVLLMVIKVLYDVKRSVKALMVELKTDDEIAALGEVNDADWSSKQKFDFWAARNKRLVTLVGLMATVGLLFVLWDGMFQVGVYEGYAPEQPIKFSHQIHAGDNGINCVYCHTSAEKGKHSGIPSVNVCMNCHRGIQEGSRWGTEEISKIHDAAGFNAETGAYDKPEKPVKWIRIHNLPDHVYFNHSQHVVVGEIECQTCHGEVETFDYPMHQEAPLTMGWCINCHRETEVKMGGNGYYEKLHAELVEKYKMEGLEKFTVEQIGGLECAKCHY